MIVKRVSGLSQVGRRLARGGLALAYNVTSAHAVDPVVDSVKLSADKSSLVVNVGGLGSKGLGKHEHSTAGFTQSLF